MRHLHRQAALAREKDKFRGEDVALDGNIMPHATEVERRVFDTRKAPQLSHCGTVPLEEANRVANLASEVIEILRAHLNAAPGSKVPATRRL